MSPEKVTKTEYQRRFIDRKDKKDLINQCEDFRFRKHGTPIARIVMYFVVVLLFSIWLLNNLMSSLMLLPPSEPPPIDDIITVLTIVTMAAITAGIVAVTILLKVRRNILETEFQSLVFASGMRINSDFCLVVHKEKAGFYCDYNFTELFSDYGEHHHDPFHQLIASEGFKQSDEDLMLKAMETGESASFTFTLKRQKKDGKKMKVSLNPLERPKGFFLIQGAYV